MTYTSLGTFLMSIMTRKRLNNVTLASLAGVSEGVIRNLLKHGHDPKAKDPDPRTLRAVADALEIDAMMLFRLAGYLPPQPNANTVRAEYLADVFDTLSKEKQDAVMGVLEAMADEPQAKQVIQTLRRSESPALSGIDLNFPALIREMANQLIGHYGMSNPADVSKIEPDAQVMQYRWSTLPADMQERIKALIRHKLSLDYDPTMVDEEWRR